MRTKEKLDAYKISRLLSCAILVCLYLAGLGFMLFGSFSIGLMLWVSSTVGGMGALYVIKNREKAARKEAERDEEE